MKMWKQLQVGIWFVLTAYLASPSPSTTQAVTVVRNVNLHLRRLEGHLASEPDPQRLDLSRCCINRIRCEARLAPMGMCSRNGRS